MGQRGGDEIYQASKCQQEDSNSKGRRSTAEPIRSTLFEGLGIIRAKAHILFPHLAPPPASSGAVVFSGYINKAWFDIILIDLNCWHSEVSAV